MREGTYILKNEAGMHARPAAVIVKIAAKYKCEATFTVNDRKASAKSLLTMIALGTKKGSEVKLTIEGEEEDQMFEELSAYIECGFNEI